MDMSIKHLDELEALVYHTLQAPDAMTEPLETRHCTRRGGKRISARPMEALCSFKILSIGQGEVSPWMKAVTFCSDSLGFSMLPTSYAGIVDEGATGKPIWITVQEISRQISA